MIGGATNKKLTDNRTGSWRSFRPIIDKSKCIGCGTCVRNCPEPCIELVNKKAVIDYDYCKGCLICKSVCPVKCITSVEESK